MMATSCRVHFLSLLVLLATFQGIHSIKYQVTNRAQETAGGRLFEKNIGEYTARRQMALASSNLDLWVFRIKESSERKQVESVTLFIDDMDGVSTHQFEGTHHQIHLSARHLESFGTQLQQKFFFLIQFEIVHVFQWTANGQTPAVLSDAIALYAVQFIIVRPKIKTPVKQTDGWSWDKKTPEVICEFLFFCAEIRPDFVAALNKKMNASYSDQYFEDLLHKDVRQLWEMFKAENGVKG